jgi:putative two-component system response regulator
VADGDGHDGGVAPADDRRAAARTNADRRMHHDALFAFARAAETHDADTGHHLVRIRLIVEHIATALGVDDAEALGYDAMLHDVGKLHVDQAILKKPGQLTPDERREMEAHTERGEAILAELPSMVRAARIARSHHECWDGSGYPDGLAGEAIPLEARITAVADVLDALVADRCYKQAWPYARALGEVCDLGGSKLDPAVVDALRRCDDAALRGVFADETPEG